MRLCAKGSLLSSAGYCRESPRSACPDTFMPYFCAYNSSQDDLVPHAQLLLLFTTSAQTHIFPEIRVDAVRFLDIFLEVIPDVVTEGWAQGSSGHGRRVLEGYLGVLSAGTAYNETGGAYQSVRTGGLTDGS